MTWWPFILRRYTFEPRQNRGQYHTLIVQVAGSDRRVEITSSPTGRSVHVYVDGKRIAR